MSKSLGLWPDGEISSYSTADGDGTVLKRSARANLSNIVEIKSDHGEITSKSLNQMAAVLGLLKTSVSSVYNDNFSDGLVVFVGSPVTSQIKCGSDTFWENDGFILVPGKNYDDCELTLSPNGDGLVHVVLGNLKTSQWNYFEDDVVVDKPEKIIIDYSKAEIKVSPSNKQFLKDRIKTNLEKLGLNKVVKFLDKNDLVVVAGLVFEYRAKHNERIVTQIILNDLFDLSLLNSGNKKESYKWLATYVDLIEDTIELKSKRKIIDKNSTLSLLSLTSLKDKTDNLVKNKTYPNKVLLTVLSLGYGVEAMR